MNPTSHAAMSGGWVVIGRRGVRGITRSAQALARKNGDTPRVARLGLDGQGVADPELIEIKSAAGCQRKTKKSACVNAPTLEKSDRASRRNRNGVRRQAVAWLKGVSGEREAETTRHPRDRLKGQPQERQHSAAVRRDAGPTAPGEGDRPSCARDRYRRPRPGIPLAGSAGLGERSE